MVIDPWFTTDNTTVRFPLCNEYADVPLTSRARCLSRSKYSRTNSTTSDIDGRSLQSLERHRLRVDAISVGNLIGSFEKSASSHGKIGGVSRIGFGTLPNAKAAAVAPKANTSTAVVKVTCPPA